MTVTTTDIGNRALQLLGTRTNVTSLVETSNEAAQITLALAPVRDWCLGLANWNFARKTRVLTLAKGPPPSSGGWTFASPAPPWLYEYLLPSDFIRAIYVTNSDFNAGNTAYLGEPKRFVVTSDVISAGIDQSVLLTNETPAILTYTYQSTDPTMWPWYFERLAVYAIAATICNALTGDKRLYDELSGMLEQQISIATQANNIEGLIIDDATPEWIQTLGVNYPYRRFNESQVGPGPRPHRQRPQRGEQ
jgi:hypothetical protein